MKVFPQPHSPTAPQPGKVPYRQDINGMRAWAVIVVLLFHFKVPGISAGFVGVDVFFVISGFLMTAIIVKGLEGNNFSIWKFYMARIRRIMPALMVLISVLLSLGWFWLPTPDYQALGSESASALGFLSNIHFWRSAGYFAAAAQEKWLLHTWSLGIEFQFYILFPIFVIVLWKIKPRIKMLFWGLGFAFLASLALSIVVSQYRPIAAFYLLPTRGWELAAGGLAFLIGREVPSLQHFSKPMFWFGFVLWLIAVFLIDDTFAWPSGWALLPVLGTVLIILSPQANSKLMLHPLAQWFGDRSYSLYLWHWPLVVALYFAGLHNDWPWVVGAFLLSLFLGNLSYWFVEKSISTYLIRSSLGKQIAILFTTSVVIVLSAISVRLFSFEGRVLPEVEIAAGEASNGPDSSFCWQDGAGSGEHDCSLLPVDEAQTSLILKGDSHSLHIRTAVMSALGASNYNNIKYWGMSGCHTIETAMHSKASGRNPFYCADTNKKFFDQYHKSGKTILIIDRTNLGLYGFNGEDESQKGPWVSFAETPLKGVIFENKFQDEYKASMCKLSEKNTLFLMRPIPEMIINPAKKLARNIILGRVKGDVKITLEEYHERNKLVWEAQDQAAEECGVKILNPLPYLCDDQYCYGSHDGRPLYYDDDHLSEHGNKFLVPMFEQMFSGKQE